ncbi:MAG: hypothetical protein H7138_16580 [Myxococcales bacterium]|nr:hypothetical protein [Myxococcales bacterium]
MSTPDLRHWLPDGARLGKSVAGDLRVIFVEASAGKADMDRVRYRVTGAP